MTTFEPFPTFARTDEEYGADIAESAAMTAQSDYDAFIQRQAEQAFEDMAFAEGDAVEEW